MGSRFSLRSRSLTKRSGSHLTDPKWSKMSGSRIPGVGIDPPPFQTFLLLPRDAKISKSFVLAELRVQRRDFLSSVKVTARTKFFPKLFHRDLANVLSFSEPVTFHPSMQFVQGGSKLVSKSAGLAQILKNGRGRGSW